MRSSRNAPSPRAGTSSPRRRGMLGGAAIALVLIAWLAVGALGGQAQGRLSTVQSNDAATFLPSSAESTRAAAAAADFVQENAVPALVVLTAGGDAISGDLPALQRLADGIPLVPISGAGAADPATIGDVLAGPPVLVPAEDGLAAMIVLSLDGPALSETLADGDRLSTVLVADLRAHVAEAIAGTAVTGLVTGPVGFIADLVNAFGGIDTVLLAVALVAVLLILMVVYRSPVLPFLVIVTAVLALCLAGLVVYTLARSGLIVLNGQAQGIMSILVVGASVDYALLLVARYREELTRTERPAEAMRAALRASIEPIGASAATVAAGLACLLLSDLASNRALGPVACVAIASAFLAALTVLPALLLASGRRARGVFWPRPPRFEAAPPDGGVHAPGQEDHQGGWARLARFVTGHDRAVWVATAGVLLASAAFVPTFRADGTSEAELFLTPVDAVAGEKVLAEHFPTGAVQPGFAIVPAGDQDAAVAAIRAVEGVSSVTVVSQDPGSGDPTAAPEPGAAPLEVDGRVRLDVVTVSGADTVQGVEAIEAVRAALAPVSSDALVGGAAAERLDTQLAGARDLRVIVPVVLGVILVILMLLLRSVLAPILLMLANVLSFAAALGVSAVVFNHVLDFPGADPAVPLYAFCFLVALGVDYTIFLMTRVREEALVVGTRRGVVDGLRVTGSVITSAGVVLAATFAALGVIPLLFLAQLAFIVALGVLIDTLVVRTLLVPALVHDVGGRVWWPGRLAS